MPRHKKKSKIKVVLLFVLTLCFLLTANCVSNETKALGLGNLPFELPEIKEPQFPNRTFCITEFGAVGDGHTMNTKAFADAIQACAQAGGGRVTVPAGLWLTGAIELKSNLNLHLEHGAIIMFSDNYEDYPLIESTWEDLPRVQCMSPLYGENLESIAITGSGIIDGAGEAWRPVKKFKMTDSHWKQLIASGGVLNRAGNIWWPTKEALNGPQILSSLRRRDNVTLEDYAVVRSFLRPVMVSLIQCKNILLDGPTFQNSPAWNIHPLLCENIIIRNVIVRNPWYSQNGDGLDLESCRNAIVTNCRFDVGDDAICLKSGRNEYGRRRGKPSENIVITDCTVYHGHGGVTIGSEMSGGVRNIYVRNCEFLGTDVGLRFKSTRGRGGIVENIFIEDVRMSNIPTEAIRFNMFYGGKAPIPEDGDAEENPLAQREVVPVSEETPQFRKIYIKNVICVGASRAVLLQGLPEMPIREIEFQNMTISAKTGMFCVDADNIKLTNVKILPEKLPQFYLYNGRNITMQDISLPESRGILMRLEGDKTDTIDLKGDNASEISKRIKFGRGVKSDAVTTR